MKTAEEITSAFSALNRDVQEYLIDALKDTSEENPREVNIALEFNAVGLSTLEMPTISYIYSDSDVIWIKYYGDDDFIELDNLYFDNLIQIVNEI